MSIPFCVIEATQGKIKAVADDINEKLAKYPGPAISVIRISFSENQLNQPVINICHGTYHKEIQWEEGVRRHYTRAYSTLVDYDKNDENNRNIVFPHGHIFVEKIIKHLPADLNTKSKEEILAHIETEFFNLKNALNKIVRNDLSFCKTPEQSERLLLAAYDVICATQAEPLDQLIAKLKYKLALYDIRDKNNFHYAGFFSGALKIVSHSTIAKLQAIKQMLQAAEDLKEFGSNKIISFGSAANHGELGQLREELDRLSGGYELTIF